MIEDSTSTGPGCVIAINNRTVTNHKHRWFINPDATTVLGRRVSINGSAVDVDVATMFRLASDVNPASVSGIGCSNWTGNIVVNVSVVEFEIARHNLNSTSRGIGDVAGDAAVVNGDRTVIDKQASSASSHSISQIVRNRYIVVDR